MMQQGQVDAISTDDVVLQGLARQDPTVDVVGESLGVEPYGVGIKKDNDDLVRFVNGALDEMRADGTWERLYDRWLRSLGPSPGPPASEVSGLMTMLRHRRRSTANSLHAHRKSPPCRRRWWSWTTIPGSSTCDATADRRDRAAVGSGGERTRPAVGRPGRMTSILESARTARAAVQARRRRSRRVDAAAARAPLELAERSRWREDDRVRRTVEYAGLADRRSDAHDYPAVVEFLDAVDEINTTGRETDSRRR